MFSHIRRKPTPTTNEPFAVSEEKIVHVVNILNWMLKICTDLEAYWLIFLDEARLKSPVFVDHTKNNRTENVNINPIRFCIQGCQTFLLE